MTVTVYNFFRKLGIGKCLYLEIRKKQIIPRIFVTHSDFDFPEESISFVSVPSLTGKLQLVWGVYIHQWTVSERGRCHPQPSYIARRGVLPGGADGSAPLRLSLPPGAVLGKQMPCLSDKGDKQSSNKQKWQITVAMGTKMEVLDGLVQSWVQKIVQAWIGGYSTEVYLVFQHTIENYMAILKFDQPLANLYTWASQLARLLLMSMERESEKQRCRQKCSIWWL